MTAKKTIASCEISGSSPHPHADDNEYTRRPQMATTRTFLAGNTFCLPVSRLLAKSQNVPVLPQPARRLASTSRTSASLNAPFRMPRFTPRPLEGRCTTLPYDLFRVNPGKRVSLRDFDTQRSRRLTSFDCYLGKDGLVHPTEGSMFKGKWRNTLFV